MHVHGRVRWSCRKAGVIATAGLLVSSLAVLPHATAAPVVQSGWQSAWLDDFNGSAGVLPASTNWRFDIGHNSPGGPWNWGTGEIEYNEQRPENVSLDGNGNLNITATKDASGGWHSARLETQRSDFKPPSGGSLRMESRIKVPDGGQGYWPAFWALGSPVRDSSDVWPAAGEIDIMENIGREPNAVHGTLHCGVNPGGPCNESTGIGSTYNSPNGQPFSTAFHTYTVVWDDTPQRLQWFVDGNLINTVTPEKIGQTTWDTAMNHGYFLLLDLAIGGGWPGVPDATTTPGRSMTIDYVSVQSTAKVTAPVTSAPTTAKPVVTTTSKPPVVSATTPSPSPSNGKRSAYAHIEAESFDQQTGIGVEATTDNGGGKDIGWIKNGDWVEFSNVEFGTVPATQFYGRAASASPKGMSGLVELRLDSRTNAPVSTFAIANTGGWQNWRTIPMNMKPVTGTHNVYVTFSSGQPSDYVNLNWISFGH